MTEGPEESGPGRHPRRRHRRRRSARSRGTTTTSTTSPSARTARCSPRPVTTARFACGTPDTGEELLEIQTPGGRADRDVGVWGPSFSPDGTRLAAAWPDAVRVIDLATKRTVVEIRADDPSSTAFSPDGKRVAFGGDGATATVADATTGEGALHGRVGGRRHDPRPRVEPGRPVDRHRRGRRDGPRLGRERPGSSGSRSPATPGWSGSSTGARTALAWRRPGTTARPGSRRSPRTASARCSPSRRRTPAAVAAWVAWRSRPTGNG